MFIAYAVGDQQTVNEIGNRIPIDENPFDYANSKYRSPGEKVYLWYGSDIDDRSFWLDGGIFGTPTADLLNSVRSPNLVVN
jgi:hypothetical protein